MASLFDSLFGVDRPALDAYVTQGQAQAGLRSAQTQEALINAQRAQEQEQAASNFKSAYMAAGHSQSEADLADSVVRGGIGKDFDSYTQGANNILKHTMLEKVADPTTDPDTRRAALLALDPASSPYTNVEGQVVDKVTRAGQGGAPSVFQTPASLAAQGVQNAHSDLLEAQAKAGGFNPHAGGAGGSPPSQADIDFAGDRYFETGQMPALGMGNGPLRQLIISSAAARARGERGAVTDMNGNGASAAVTGNVATNKANTGMLSDMTKRAAVADASEETANTNLQLAQHYMTAADQTGSPLVNAIQNKIRAGVLGDPDVSAYQNALTTAANEYARVISMATGAQGITDAARAEGARLFNPNLAPAQLAQNITVAQQEMANRTGSLHAQIAKSKQNLFSGPSPAPAPQGGAPATPAAAGPAVAPPSTPAPRVIQWNSLPP